MRKPLRAGPLRGAGRTRSPALFAGPLFGGAGGLIADDVVHDRRRTSVGISCSGARREPKTKHYLYNFGPVGPQLYTTG